MAPEIQEKLLGFLSLHYGIPRESMDTQASLTDQGVIDSLGFVEIVLFLEKEFSIAVAPSQITPDNFDSVTRIVDFVAAAFEAALNPSEPPMVG